MPPHPSELWTFLPLGYLLTVAIELPILAVGLSGRHSMKRRIAAGFWLTACTYPIVVLTFPYLVWEPYGYTAYLAVAETFAPAAECLLFWLAYLAPTPPRTKADLRDFAAIVAANLASFLLGLLIL